MVLIALLSLALYSAWCIAIQSIYGVVPFDTSWITQIPDFAQHAVLLLLWAKFGVWDSTLVLMLNPSFLVCFLIVAFVAFKVGPENH